MQKIKKYKFHILAFLIPIICCLFILFVKGYITDKTIFKSDMLAQYVSFFEYYKNMLLGEENLFYSFSKGIGGSMISTFSYYLASPLNILIVFFPIKHLPIFMVVLLVLKIGLISLNMYVYLDHLNRKNNNVKISLCVCYSMMAYVINYYFNIMWLDSLYMLPLVILGIDKIFEGEKTIFYVVTLFLTIWINYYIGFMVCIFSCLYFVYKLILNHENLKNNKKKIIFRFLISSLLAGLLTSLITIPTLYELQNSSKSLNTFFTTHFEVKFNIFDFISKGYIGSYNEKMILNMNSVNWYIGMLPIVLLINYFCSKGITKKEKLLSLIMILVFLLSFSISHINYIWHGFNIPVCFNYRYSFIFCFFIIVLAFKGYNKFDLSKTKCLVSLFIFIIISIIVELFNYIYIKNYLVWICVGLFILYMAILNLEKKVDEKQRNLLSLLLCLLVIGEITLNYYFTIRDYEFVYIKEHNFNIEYGNLIKKYSNKNDSKFQRVETNNIYTLNNGLLHNYNGITTFNSTLNKNLSKFANNVGFTNFAGTIIYGDGNTPIIDSILGIKYKFSTSKNSDLYDIVEKYNYKSGTGLLFGLLEADSYVYENDFSLNLGYMVSEEVLNFENRFKNIENINNFEYQNLLLNTMLNNNTRYLEENKLVNVENEVYEFEIDNDENFYLYIPSEIGNNSNSFIKIYINDELITNYTSSSQNVVLVENKYNDTIKVSYVLNGDVLVGRPYIYYLNELKFKEDIKNIQQNQLIITSFNDTHIKGNIEISDDKKVLFLSIPYEEGWHIYVDGKEVKKEILYDTFIGVKLNDGKHEIDISYYPPGLNLGIGISCGAFVILVLYLRFCDKN